LPFGGEGKVPAESAEMAERPCGGERAAALFKYYHAALFVEFSAESAETYTLNINRESEK